MSYKITIQHAIEAEKRGHLREWVLDYLDGEGNNSRLAYELRKRQTAQVLLKKHSLKPLKRVMGPEPSMIWREDEKEWNMRVENIKEHINNTATIPPLICTDFWDGIHISDGNHRQQALLDKGFNEYWVIFFLLDKNNMERLKK